MNDQVAPPNGLPLLQADGLIKRFADGTLAVDRVDVALARGSFVSLVGPSGCGKSTILRLIAGLERPSAGRLVWPGGRPDEIGFVFQDATLMPWARAVDNVYLPLKLAGVSRRAAMPKVEAALDLVGLGDRGEALPSELSGGMRMRVSIARALATDAPLLLMDEPFAALDEFTREKLDEDLLRLWLEKGLTVLFVTHSIYEAVYLSERVAVMGRGRKGLIADIAIDEPYPRDGAFRESAAYLEYCRQVSKALREGIQP